MAVKTYCLNPARKQWAFLAYIAADNNLSDAGLVDINEMCVVGASPLTHVGMEIDTYGEHDGSIRYEITEPDWLGRAHRVVIQRLSEHDSGTPEVLSSFMKWGLARFRAVNHVAVMWNHGSGFRNPRRDIAFDDFGSSLDMSELSAALSRAGVNRNHKLSILGFDACLMNMIEIANHFSSQVHIVVGSQQTEPFAGWPYDKVMKLLKRPISRAQLARGIVKAYITDYRAKGASNVTQSAVDTLLTHRAIRAVHRLGGLLAGHFTQYETILRNMRLDIQAFEMADYVDLIHFATLVGPRVRNLSIAQAAAEVVRSTRACILANGRLGKSVKNAHGLSIWFPAQKELYFQYRPKYLRLRCNTSRSGWVRFLDRYHLG